MMFTVLVALRWTRSHSKLETPFMLHTEEEAIDFTMNIVDRPTPWRPKSKTPGLYGPLPA